MPPKRTPKKAQAIKVANVVKETTEPAAEDITEPIAEPVKDEVVEAVTAENTETAEEAPAETVEQVEESVGDETPEEETSKEDGGQKKNDVGAKKKRYDNVKAKEKWEEKQRMLAKLLEGKEKTTPEANQYQLLVPTELAEKLSQGDTLKLILNQTREVDAEADIVLDVSEETEVEIEEEEKISEEQSGAKEASVEGSEATIDEEGGDKSADKEVKKTTEMKKAADSILMIYCTRDGLKKAVSLLAPELHLVDSDPPRIGYELRLMVPNHCIMVIIGSRGQTVLEARKATAAFIQGYTDSLPMSQENVVRIQHKEFEGLVNAVMKIYDIIADSKSSEGIVQYRPFWFKQGSFHNSGSYTDTFHYEKILPPNNRNTPFFDNTAVKKRAQEKKKRKLAAQLKTVEEKANNKKRGGASTQGPPASKRGRGAPNAQRGARGGRGVPRGRGAPQGMGAPRGMHPGMRPPHAGRGMRGLGGAQRIASSPARRGRGGIAPLMANPSYTGYQDFSGYDDSYMDEAYMGDSYMDESYMGDFYADESYMGGEDAYAAGMAQGLAAGMAMARQAIRGGMGVMSPRGRGSRGRLGSRGAKRGQAGRNMGASRGMMGMMGYGRGGYW